MKVTCAKETYSFIDPTIQSHPISWVQSGIKQWRRRWILGIVAPLFLKQCTPETVGTQETRIQVVRFDESLDHNNGGAGGFWSKVKRLPRFESRLEHENDYERKMPHRVGYSNIGHFLQWLFEKEPLIIGLFCRKRPIFEYPTRCRKFWSRHLLPIESRMHIFDCSSALRWGWVFLERTRILSGIQFTTYLVELTNGC